MSKWWYGPYWVAERGSRRDDAGRTYQIDYQITELHITNPTDRDGVVDLVFYEARADGNFYRSDWASGSWTTPPRWQRHYRPDPSRVFGDRFYTNGWFEAWTSLDDVLFDVRVSAIARNNAGGVVHNISQRTIDLIPRRRPLDAFLPEILDMVRGDVRSRLYTPGEPPSDDMTPPSPPPDDESPGMDG